MLYESTYNQYFLEHSWGPWKKHLYISRDEKNGRFVYKYPKEYYDKYKFGQAKRFNAFKSADKNELYRDEYYNTAVDKVINNAVMSTVKVLNFGLDMRDKAKDYLNRFGNAVANAWNTTKSRVSGYVNTGKNYISNLKNKSAEAFTSGKERIAASVQNLIKGAGEAISKGWNQAKDTAGRVRNQVNTTADRVRNQVNTTADRVRNQVNTTADRVRNSVNDVVNDFGERRKSRKRQNG